VLAPDAARELRGWGTTGHKPDILQHLRIRRKPQSGQVQSFEVYGALVAAAVVGVSGGGVVVPADEHVGVSVFQLLHDNRGNCVMHAVNNRLNKAAWAKTQSLVRMGVSGGKT
jgi:hypothetical protein